MRTGAVVAGGTAAAAAAVVWATRSAGARQSLEAMSHGAAPGRLGSWMNSWMDGPTYRAFAQVLDLRHEDELLDVACGWGEFLVSYANGARRVTGVDLAPAKVALARKRLVGRIRAGTAEVIVADALRLPFPDAIFTAVTCIDAFPFFPDPQAVLSEMFRVLRPGGRCVVTFAAQQLPPGVTSRTAHGFSGTYTAISEATARSMVESAGFDPVTVSWVPVAGGHERVGAVLRVVAGAELEDIVIGRKPLVTAPH